MKTTDTDRSGKVQIYTGDGKGKTTAALGLAMRASGHGIKSAVVRFLKSGTSGELDCGNPFISYFTFGCDEMYRAGTSDFLKYRKFCSDALEFIKSAVFRDGYSILICDEILYACRFGLISEEEIADLAENRPASMEMVLTGNYLTPGIADLADMISEISCVKHYFNTGIPARKGVEF